MLCLPEDTESRYRRYYNRSRVPIDAAYIIFLAVLHVLSIKKLISSPTSAWPFKELAFIVGKLITNVSCLYLIYGGRLKLYLQHREVIIFVQRLVCAATGLCIHSKVFLSADRDSMSWAVFWMNSVGAWWPLVWLYMCGLQLPLMLHMSCHAIVMFATFASDCTKCDLLLSSHPIAHEKYAVVGRWLASWLPASNLGAHLALPPLTTCIVISNVTHQLMAFILPTIVMYRLEVASRKRWLESNDAPPGMTRLIAHYDKTSCLMPVLGASAFVLAYSASFPW